MTEKIVNIEDELLDDDIPEIIDFTKAIHNPYINGIRKDVSINMPVRTLNYFRDQAEKLGVSYQTVITLYLSECANNKREIRISN
ncbi:MAG: hypothetical protein II969_17620 [Anaerolineaceae bacterium]|nr:hypothetical protein [Anaerolineaceae bacterium]